MSPYLINVLLEVHTTPGSSRKESGALCTPYQELYNLGFITLVNREAAELTEKGEAYIEALLSLDIVTDYKPVFRE